MSEKNIETEYISDAERKYRTYHKDKPDNSKNPYLIIPSIKTSDDDEENISNEERRYRSYHNRDTDGVKNPHLISVEKKTDSSDNEQYMSEAERRFRETHKNEFESRRQTPYIISRGKTPEEIARERYSDDGDVIISNAERRYRARHKIRHSEIAMNNNEGQSREGTTFGSEEQKRGGNVKRRKHKDMPVPIRIINHFIKYLLLCVGLSTVFTILFDRGYILADEKELLYSLSIMGLIYVIINLFLFNKKLRHTRSRTKYYRVNYIAYIIFAIFNLVMCLVCPSDIYTRLFAITEFLFHSHMEIPVFLSACIFHVLMLIVISVLTRVRLRIKIKH